MTHFRRFRNSDTPALTGLWNRGTPEMCVVRPLTVHEFDEHIVGAPYFEAEGLIVAERDGVPIAYAHAGFGPGDPADPPLQLSYEIGTVAMLIVDRGSIDPDVERSLLTQAEKYLRSRGAKVVYAGGQFPLNPFYWGFYGGSEWAGVLSGHTAFHRAALQAGFEPVSTTVLLEADMTGPPRGRDPRSVMIRRNTRLDVSEDALPKSWWEALAIGDFRPTHYRLVARSDETVLASATTWDMTWFGRRDGRSRIGMLDLEVHRDHRRKGYGRYLVDEIDRLARSQSIAAVSVQTRSTNTPATALYQSLGFVPVENATLYRLPAGTTGH